MNKEQQIKKAIAEFDNEPKMDTYQLVDNVKQIISNTNDEYIILSKNKLVLLSKLLKEVRAEYESDKGHEIKRYKLKTQRNVVESFGSSKDINLWINRCKAQLSKMKLEKQLQQENNEV